MRFSVTSLDGFCQIFHRYFDAAQLAVDSLPHRCHVEFHHRAIRTEPDIFLLYHSHIAIALLVSTIIAEMCVKFK